MEFLKSKFAPIASSIFIGIGLIIGINFLLIKINSPIVKTNQNIEAKYTYEKFDEDADRSIIKLYKERTVSLAFIKNENEKINGTAWIKQFNENDNSFTLATNLHVIASFVKYNTNTKRLSFNDSFSVVNVHYFNNLLDSQLYIERTSVENWSIGNHMVMQERVIPDIPDYHNKQNVFRNYQDGMYYINNGYVDYIELIFKPSVKTSKEFRRWLYDAKPLDFNKYFMNSQDLANVIKNNDFELFIAGFPLIDGKIKWIEQKIVVKPDKDNGPGINQKIVQLTTTPEVIGTDSWLDKDEKFSIDTNVAKNISQRNIANQITIRNLIMGNGSSGSMISMRVGQEIKIVGIWWGNYGTQLGSGDLLWSNSYQPYTKSLEWANIHWNGYNLVKS